MNRQDLKELVGYPSANKKFSYKDVIPESPYNNRPRDFRRKLDKLDDVTVMLERMGISVVLVPSDYCDLIRNLLQSNALKNAPKERVSSEKALEIVDEIFSSYRPEDSPAPAAG
ncbi:hypothetical protein [Lewinella sp. W8]|uniref:hypothetical protein n=1 Tax=Lewinella sp. W8 TaxID=2528208 RepID=UPI001067F94A|nr:hypothetical protein [Lewinella sp. W8]MTB53006.1 hypothetical protein [Lewinella sp. W8]